MIWETILTTVDVQGRTHITDTPPPAGARDVQRKRYRSAAAEAGQVASYELSQAMKDFPVTLYTAPVQGSSQLGAV